MASDETLQQLRNFIAERDWNQFHSPENLAKSIAIEAAELLELFQWESDAKESEVKDELADVFTYCLLLADKYGFDIDSIVTDKLEKSKSKYPVDKSKGKSSKYDRL